MKNSRKKIIIIVVITIILFIVSSYYSNKFEDDLKNLPLLKSGIGEIIYIIIMITAVIVAPFETLPLIPAAVALWGPIITAMLTIIGWTIGALIAFGLARRFGRKFVCRFIDKCDIEEWGSILPKRNVFWLVVLARFILPVDIISYAVGIFTKMGWLPYLAATVIGIIPFAFIFSYGAELPPALQAVAGVIGLILIILGYNSFKHQFKKWGKSGWF